MTASHHLPYVVCALVALGCNRNEARPAPSRPAPTPTTAAPTPTTAAPTPPPAANIPGRIELTGAEYNVSVQITGGPQPMFKLDVRGAGEYHVNENYPIAVEVTDVTNGTMEKRSFRRTDASEFSPAAARFTQAIQSTGAGTAVSGTVRFGVCRAEQCGFFTREFAVTAP